MGEVTIRELKEDDIQKGFLKTLDTLKQTSSISQKKALEIFKEIKANDKHIIIIAELNEEIVGTTTLLVEPKFIHQGGKVGHIEDVVVR